MPNYLEIDGKFQICASDLQVGKKKRHNVLRKEVIYVASFKPNNGPAFEIDEKTIDIMVSENNRMIQAGHKIPVPVVTKEGEHSFDPLLNKGKVLSFEKAKDQKGRIGLFAIMKFDDANITKSVKSTDVSLFSVSKIERNGVVYKQPILHVALTSYPQIPDLEGFTIAASLTLKEVTDMSLKDALAKAFEIDCGDDTPDEDVCKSLSTVINERVSNAIRKATDTLKSKEKSNDKPKSKEKSNDKPKSKEKSNDKSEDTKEFSIPDGMRKALISSERDRRERKILSLVQNSDGPLISPAAAKELTQKYCSDEILSLSLDLDSMNSDFDSVIDTLSKNSPIVKTGENSGPQMKLSEADLTNPKKNPMMACAEVIIEREKANN